MAKRIRQKSGTAKVSATEKALRQVAVERRRLDERQSQLLKRSIREQRAKGNVALKAAAKSRKRVFRLLGEGDSWMKYDCGFGFMHYVDWLFGSRAVCVNIGGSGATMAGMMRSPARNELENQLRKGIDGKPWDALLFSGGGNDFCGDHFKDWLLPYEGQTDPATAIAQPLFKGLLDNLATLYGQLANIVRTRSPNTIVLVNGYDFAIPNGRGVPFAGPWLKPGFDERNYPAAIGFRTEVVKIMLLQFAGMLNSVNAVYPFVRLVSTQGALTTSQWDNELHPTNKGFERIARIFISRVETEITAA